MITAKLEYTHFKPLSISELEFTGKQDVANILNELSYMIEDERYDEHKLRIKMLTELKAKMLGELIDWQNEIKKFKKENFFWMLKKEKRETMNELKKRM